MMETDYLTSCKHVHATYYNISRLQKWLLSVCVRISVNTRIHVFFFISPDAAHLQDNHKYYSQQQLRGAVAEHWIDIEHDQKHIKLSNSGGGYDVSHWSIFIYVINPVYNSAILTLVSRASGDRKIYISECRTKDTRVKRQFKTPGNFCQGEQKYHTFLPPWTEDTKLFCHPEQKTPHYFANLDRRHHYL